MIPVRTLPGTRPDYFGQDMFFDIVVNRITKDYPLHWHDFYELEYIESGHATQIINGKSYQMSPGFVVLLSPVDFHSYENVSADDPLVIHNIRFSDLILPSTIRNKLSTCALSQLADMSHIIPVFRQLIEEYRNADFGREEFIRSTITQLCIMVLRQANIESQISSKPTAEQYSPIQEAVLYIRNHYRDSITIDEVAGIVHLT
ncbi:MAG: AraC family ligand binding domain-containing protein, partial [Oscillospiraceae bacterium]|nr:AraC family ligand binding domain-containing protein [Oscillospiraceae bacterium]